MTLKEFLETIGLHSDECTNENNPILKFNIQILHNENYAIEYQLSYDKFPLGITQAKVIDIDNNEKTITFK